MLPSKLTIFEQNITFFSFNLHFWSAIIPCLTELELLTLDSLIHKFMPTSNFSANS